MKLLILTVLLVFVGSSLFAQPSKERINSFKNSFGFHINPAFDEFNDLYYPVNNRKLFAYAFRYGIEIHKNFNFGPEVSGYTRKHFEDDVMSYKSSVIKIGCFFRAKINKLNYIRPFLETSLYYFNCKSIINMGYYDEDSFNTIRGYFAPGISLYIFNNRFSLDIMYKFGDEFVNMKKHIISYRINYNFNFKK